MTDKEKYNLWITKLKIQEAIYQLVIQQYASHTTREKLEIDAAISILRDFEHDIKLINHEIIE